MAFNLFKRVQQELSDTTRDQSSTMPDVPKDVRNFLGRLSLLQGIPWYYLLPDERYLPKQSAENLPVEKGSLRLFWLDKEWIECLLDGALSVGTDSEDSRKLLLAKAMAGNYAAEVFYEDVKEQVKKQITGLYAPDEFKQQLDKRIAARNISFFPNGQPMPTVAQNNWCYTGFIMRSMIIPTWVGVQIVANGADPNASTEEAGTNLRPLQVIRFERIAEDTIFCMCEGIIKDVTITQPPETTHFGITDSTNIKRQNSADGVLDIAAIMKTLPAGSGSAALANAMLARPAQIHLTINWTKENN